MFDVDKIRSDFPMFQNNDFIYFDNGATTFKPRQVIDEILKYYEFNTTNVHRGDYDISFKVSKAYDDTRNVVGKFINCESDEVVFTSGTTHSLNQAANYLKQILNEGDIVLTTLIEHASNILPLFEACKLKKATIKYIDVDSEGYISFDSLKSLMSEKVKAVSISHVSNVLGCIQPIKEISKIVHSYNSILIVDGAQSTPHIKIDVKDLDVDMFSFSAHKMCGPNGIGVLYAKKSILEKMEPIFYGGGSNARFSKCCDIVLKDYPEKFESGTPNIEGVLALSKAIQYLENLGMENIHKREVELKEYFIKKLKELDNIEIYNPNTKSSIVSFNVKNVFAQDAASYLGNKNICVRSGNHCAKLLFEIIGVNESIRASLYFYNTFDEIDRFVNIVKEISIDSVIDIFF
ncbi:MAG: aminotransferase class V-fold PLP-dependent enzyme [Erysipelotrichaceae bacterium]|nr:aminotransferase class V-fold PLP-dependent enzyme [Erysipelotrichaceae bacterium]